MDERLQLVLRNVPIHELSRVAAGALGVADATIDAPPDLTEITTPHAEDRTIGIVKVSGTAAGRAWTSVAKLVDLGVPAPARLMGVTAPENEELVYEEGYFVGEGLPLRPAHCYFVSRPTPLLKVIWLEDLTEAKGPPFSLDEIAQIARHFGEWNGRQAAQPPTLNFPVGRDCYVMRFRGWDHATFLKRLRELETHPAVRAMYRHHSLDMAATFVGLMERLLERSATQPHSLAFGDCSAGNLFCLPGETVAIDWASLTDDPLGVDGGCSVGSCTTWGTGYAEVVTHERELFEHYLAGLRSSGWRFDTRDVRRAAFGHLGHYLTNLLTMPVIVADGMHRTFLEKRFGMPLEAMPERGVAAIDAMPSYIDELRELLA